MSERLRSPRVAVVPTSKSARVSSGSLTTTKTNASRSETTQDVKRPIVSFDESKLANGSLDKVPLRKPVRAVVRNIPVMEQQVISDTSLKSPRVDVDAFAEFKKSVSKEMVDDSVVEIKSQSSARRSPRSSVQEVESVSKDSVVEIKSQSSARRSPRSSVQDTVEESSCLNSQEQNSVKIISISDENYTQQASTITDNGVKNVSSRVKYIIPPVPIIRDTSQSSLLLGEVKTAKMKSKKHSKRNKLYKQYKVPKGHQLVKAGDRYYVVKKYQKMSPEEQQLEYTEMEMQFHILNRNWNRQGISFRMPKPDENLVNIQVRLQQYNRFARSRMGSDSYKLMLIFGWVVTECVLCSLSIPAQHYTETQIELFDLYQNRLIEMGEAQGGFGQDWSPMTWILVMSAVNAAVLIGLNKMCDGVGAQTAMRSVTALISGNSPAVDEKGVPLPPEQQPAVANPIGDLLNKYTGGDPNSKNPLLELAGKYLPGILGAFNSNRVENKKTARGRRGPTFA